METKGSFHNPHVSMKRKNWEDDRLTRFGSRRRRDTELSREGGCFGKCRIESRAFVLLLLLWSNNTRNKGRSNVFWSDIKGGIIGKQRHGQRWLRCKTRMPPKGKKSLHKVNWQSRFGHLINCCQQKVKNITLQELQMLSIVTLYWRVSMNVKIVFQGCSLKCLCHCLCHISRVQISRIALELSFRQYGP